MKKIVIKFSIVVSFFGASEQVKKSDIQKPTRENVAKYLKEHNNSAPPASWYKNGNPWRGLTADEANTMLEDCEEPIKK